MHAISRLVPLIRNASFKLCSDGRMHQPTRRDCVCYINASFVFNLLETRRSYSLTYYSNPYKYSTAILYNQKGTSDLIRTLSLTSISFDKDTSSKVNKAIEELTKKQKEKEKAVAKKPLKQRIWDELVHYYHGFRLLFINVKISSGLVRRVIMGKTLTRREYRLLSKTVGDLFRLVPFSVFIVVPFMEFTLPFFIKFFPGMLPSTFQTTSEKKDKLKRRLKIQLETAKFLQTTLESMAVQQHNERSSQQAKEFVEWINKVRTTGEPVCTEEILKYSKLFRDEITLDSLSRSQLIALCRVLDVQALGTSVCMRFLLKLKLRSLAADDRMIRKEGVHSLTLPEVQQACRARGMRAYGLSEKRLRAQLEQWLELSLDQQVPPSLLLLSRALMLPETIPTTDKLKATISALPETIITQTQADIGKKEGKIDNKIMVEVLKEEVAKIKEERAEHREEKKKLQKEQARDKDSFIDEAPIISAEDTPTLEDAALKTQDSSLSEKVPAKEHSLQSEDIKIIESAIDKVSTKQKFIVEKEELQELKTEMADYKQEAKKTKAAKRLFKSVNRMINRLDKVLVELGKKEKQLKKDLEIEATDKKKEELLKIDDIISAIHKIKGVPDNSKIEKIRSVLKKIDDDKDGSLKAEDVLRVIEIIGKENVKLTSKQIDELIDLIDKEQILEVEDKIEKALQKDKESKEAQKDAQHQTQSKSKQVRQPAATSSECDDSIEKDNPKNCKCTSLPKSKLNSSQTTIILPPSNNENVKDTSKRL